MTIWEIPLFSANSQTSFTYLLNNEVSGKMRNAFDSCHEVQIRKNMGLNYYSSAHFVRKI